MGFKQKNFCNFILCRKFNYTFSTSISELLFFGTQSCFVQESAPRPERNSFLLVALGELLEKKSGQAQYKFRMEQDAQRNTDI